MAYFSDVESKSEVRALVIQDLKDLGIKIPKQKKCQDNKENTGGVFGNHLCNLPCVATDDCDQVPRFLTDSFACIKKHIETEGLFRKNGSLARQKVLKDTIERGESVQDSCIFDVTSLIKRFFRELPDCLFTSWLYDLFLQAYELETEENRSKAILYLCFLLPAECLSSLRFTMLNLEEIAAKSEQNKMDISNLAVVMTPNILRTEKNEKNNSNENKLLQNQTAIVEFLIKNASLIGMVADDLAERAQMMSSCFVSGDELDSGFLNNSQPKKKKRRSGSLQGLVSNIRESLGKWRPGSRSNSRQSLTSQSEPMSICPDNSAMDVDDNGGFPVDATPKVIMRKRKAEDEVAPFSASKRKAILQQISTPYTPVSILRNAKKHNVPQMNLDESPTIKFSMQSNVPPFTGTPGHPKVASPKKKPKMFQSPANFKKRMQSPKVSPKKKKGLFRRLSGSSKSSSQGDGGSPIIGSRLARDDISITENDTSTASSKLGKKRHGLFKRHKKHPSSPARLVGPNMIVGSNSSSVSNDGCESLNSSHRGNDSLVIENSSAIESMSDSDLAKKLKQDLIRQSPVIKRSLMPVPSSDIKEEASRGRAHKRALSVDRSSLKRGQPNTVNNGLANIKRPPTPIRKGSITKADISLPISVTLPASQRKFAEPEANQPDLITVNNDSSSYNKGNLNYSVDSDVRMKSEAHSHEMKMPNMECASSVNSTICLVANKGDDEGRNSPMRTASDSDLFKVPAAVTKMAFSNENSASDVSMIAASDQSPNISMDSTTSSNTSIITVIDRFATDTNLPRTSSRISNFSEPEQQRASVDNNTDLDVTPTNLSDSSTNKPSLLHAESLESLDSGVSSLRDSNENLSSANNEKQVNNITYVDKNAVEFVDVKRMSQQKKALSLESLQSVILDSTKPKNPIKRVQSLNTKNPNLQVSPETLNLLTNAGFVKDDPKSLEDSSAEVMSLEFPQKSNLEKPVHESVVNLRQAKIVSESLVPIEDRSKLERPVHESVLNLQNAARVTTNKTIFSNTDENQDMKEIADRHASPLRFHRSALRCHGNSPVRIPTIFARSDEEALRYREVARNAVKRIGSMSRKPNIPIGTDLVKSKSVESALVRLQKQQIQEAANVAIMEKPVSLNFVHDANNTTEEVNQMEISVDALGISLSNETETKDVALITVNQEVIRLGLPEKQRDNVFEENLKQDIESIDDGKRVALASLQQEMLNVLLKKDLNDEAGIPESLQNTINDVCTPTSQKNIKNDDRKITPNRFSSTSELKSSLVSLDTMLDQGKITPSGRVIRKNRRRSAPVRGDCGSREREVNFDEIKKALRSDSTGVLGKPLLPTNTPQSQINQPFLEFYKTLTNSGNQITEHHVDTPSKQPLRNHNPVDMTNAVATPVIKPSLITRDLAKLRTSGGYTPRSIKTTHIRCTPRNGGQRYRSPVKPVKRLNSPASPRHTKSPRKYPNSPVHQMQMHKKSELSPIPSHLRDDFEAF